MEWEALQVCDRLLGTREDGLVERLHFVHGAGQAFGVALGLARQAPRLGEGLEIRELSRQESIGHFDHTSARERRYSSTQSFTTLFRCRHMNSWSPSGTAETTRDSSPICVASSVPQSCRAYSLMVAMPSCWARCSRTLRGGAK